jgi:hypothetical protein
MKSALDLPVPRSDTALMQYLQHLVGREGHRLWCGGTVPRKKFAAFVEKMAARYPIARDTRGRAYDRKRGRAVVHFVVFPAGADAVSWWLLSSSGQGGLADPASPDAHVAQDAMSAASHITHADYVLLYATKTAAHAVTDAKSGKVRRFVKDTSTWTWKMRAEVVAQERARIDRCCSALEYGAESGPDGKSPGWGLRGLLAELRARPLFSGVRNQVIDLHRYARDAWSKQRGKWLERHPDYARRYGQHAGQLRPLNEVLARRLPMMRRMKVFDSPALRIADLVEGAPGKA